MTLKKKSLKSRQQATQVAECNVATLFASISISHNKQTVTLRIEVQGCIVQQIQNIMLWAAYEIRPYNQIDISYFFTGMKNDTYINEVH